MDVTGGFAIYIAVGEKAGFIPQLPGASQEESIFLFIASFLFTSASAEKALHSPLTQRRWVLLIAHKILGG